MNQSFININNNQVELPNGSYAERNAKSILLAGHVYNSIENREEPIKCQLNASEEDKKLILDELENAECCLFPSIKMMGELISAVDREELEDSALNYAGHLVSTLTELLYSVQNTKKLVKYSVENSEELS